MTSVDDSDSRIAYDGRWIRNDDPSKEEFQSTNHRSPKSGGQATFSFTGTSVVVFGSVSPAKDNPPRTTYSVDGTPYSPFADPNSLDYGHKLFESPLLKPGDHILVVSPGDDFFWLDYIRYTEAPKAPLPSPKPLPSNPSTQSTIATSPPESSPATPAPPPNTSPTNPPTVALASSSSSSQSLPSHNDTALAQSQGTSSTTISGISVSATSDSRTSTSPSSPAVTSDTSTVPTSQPATPKNLSLAALLAVIGAVIIILLVLILLLLWFRRRKAAAKAVVPFTSSPHASPTVAAVSTKGAESESDTSEGTNFLVLPRYSTNTSNLLDDSRDRDDISTTPYATMMTTAATTHSRRRSLLKNTQYRVSNTQLPPAYD